MQITKVRKALSKLAFEEASELTPLIVTYIGAKTPKIVKYQRMSSISTIVDSDKIKSDICDTCQAF